MSEMEKMGMSKPRGRPRTEETPNGTPAQRERAPRVELSTSNETFNLIARSLLNVSDQIPALVRDTAELKIGNTELKHLIWQLNNSIVAMQNDIAFIANTMSEVLPQGKPRMKLADIPDEPMPTILRNIVADPNNR